MRSGGAIAFRATVVVVAVALVCLVGITTSSSVSSASSVTSASPKAVTIDGNDISWPQCGAAYPSGQAFGIVGINDGVPGTLNPCLGPSASDPSDPQSELYWALSTSTGSSAQPKASLYVNTSDPGDAFDGTATTGWPTSGSTPYGACTTTTVTTSSGPTTVGQNSPACAWEFGDREAANDATLLRGAADTIDAQSPVVSVPATPGKYPWWLDVETTNSWQKGSAGQAMNVAVLQGFVVGLDAAGATGVGVYSTSYQWGVITGGTSSSTASLGKLATWEPGASDEAGAQAMCGG
ncbi:MAG TPA: hypothetical protein VMD28_01200, partial [Acidimicrobiales bacterium]|nr:hypothetical protein [Acidimicrobiales bacterium]